MSDRALRFLEQRVEARTAIALVADPAESGRRDVCCLRAGEGCDVVMMPGNGIGYEEEFD
jgi:hypothetical protein